MGRLILLFTMATAWMYADTVINGNRTILGTWDASHAKSSKPITVGTTLPAACATGEMFLKTNAQADRSVYACVQDNTWTQQGGGYGQGLASALPAACTAGQIYFATDASAGRNLYFCSTANTWTQMSGGTTSIVSTFGVSLDGSGAAITTGQKGYVTVPYACTVTGWSLQADQAGTLAVELDKKAGAIPQATTDSMVGAAPPSLTSSQLAQSTALSGWNTSVNANDVIGFQVTVASAVTRATLVVNCLR